MSGIGRQHRVLRCGALLLVAMLASGCAPFRHGSPTESVASAPTVAAVQGAGAAIARQALSQVGAPYRYGGTEPAGGFDCSGLVAYAHGLAGIEVPRTAAAQFAAAREVTAEDLQPGDLVFFRLVQGSSEVTHVGIYTGQGGFVHAPQTGKRVGEASLEDPYYRQRFAGAGRLYPEGPGEGPRLQPPAR
jgi:cell wall-associated NlpC family hydrolase